MNFFLLLFFLYISIHLIGYVLKHCYGDGFRCLKLMQIFVFRWLTGSLMSWTAAIPARKDLKLPLGLWIGRREWCSWWEQGSFWSNCQWKMAHRFTNLRGLLKIVTILFAWNKFIQYSVPIFCIEFIRCPVLLFWFRLNNAFVPVFFPLYAVFFTVGNIFCSVFPQVLQVPIWYGMVWYAAGK